LEVGSQDVSIWTATRLFVPSLVSGCAPPFSFAFLLIHGVVFCPPSPNFVKRLCVSLSVCVLPAFNESLSCCLVPPGRSFHRSIALALFLSKPLPPFLLRPLAHSPRRSGSGFLSLYMSLLRLPKNTACLLSYFQFTGS